jgi:16S rRNA (cytosine1402-N4)-methyltransferase
LAGRLARAIVEERKKNKIKTTTALAEIAAATIGRRGRLHPATRIFQALRLVVNDELGQLEGALPAIIKILKAGGRLAVISFHSLEDRIVKNFFKTENNKTLKIINKHVIVPSEEERESNLRSRSAKLRVVEKI